MNFLVRSKIFSGCTKIRCFSNTGLSFPIVETKYGKVRGKSGFNYQGGMFYSFQGIPYAKPPLGDLRFKAPVASPPWSGTRDCTIEGNEPISFQRFDYHKPTGSEDCLYLNIFTPKLPDSQSSSLKPVMFFVHGGRLTLGSSKASVYGPEILMTEDIVLVTLNYRLGILGFLSMKDSSLGVPGNAGFKDVLLGLKWIKENVERFGGDPNNITLFGNSAGAAAVHTLMLSPLANGLFERAILQSGSLFCASLFGEKSADKIAKKLGYDSTNEKNILKFLTEVPATKFLEVQKELPLYFGGSSPRYYSLVVEDQSTEPAIISKPPIDVAKSGDYKHRPLIVGWNSNEGLYCFGDRVIFNEIFGQFENVIPAHFNVKKGSQLSKEIANKIKEAYYGSESPTLENIDKFYKIAADFIIHTGLCTLMKYHMKCAKTPLYFYRFSADTTRNMFKKYMNINTAGACHGDELGYLFQPARVPKPTGTEHLIVQRMVKLWTNFAKTSNPNPTQRDDLINVTWKPMEEDKYQGLDIGLSLTYGEIPEAKRVEMWEDLYDWVKLQTR